jgi:hypothetical protein
MSTPAASFTRHSASRAIEAAGSEARFKTAVEDEARQVNVQVQFLDVQRSEDFDAAVALAVRQGAGAVYVSASPVTYAHQAQIVSLASKYRLPAAGSFRVDL